MNGCFLMAPFIVMTLVRAPGVAAQVPLIVLHAGADTESAAPFYQAFERKHRELSRSARGAMSGIRHLGRPHQDVDMGSFFPIRSSDLTLGAPQVKRVNQLGQPVFLIGMDHRSIQWLRHNLQTLRRLKARGVVVQADDYASFAQLRAQAATLGLALSALSGDSLARGYQLRTYPTLLIGASHGR